MIVRIHTSEHCRRWAYLSSDAPPSVNPIWIDPATKDPTVPARSGMVYYNTTTQETRMFYGGKWVTLSLAR